MIKKTITYGVIVYNVQNYLRECLDSVSGQKGDDIEIVIVDDGSTDLCVQICDEYAAKDNRIKVIHKENGGASTARNRVIEEASGDWICFVDGDDIITENASDIIRKNISDDYQIVFFDVVYFRNVKSIPQYKTSLAPLEISSEKDMDDLRNYMMYGYIDDNKYVNKTIVTSWGKVYSRNFIIENNIRFNPLAIKGQDTVFSFACMKNIKKVLLVREAIYLYRQNMKSIVNKYNARMTEYHNNLAAIFRELAESYDGKQREGLMERYYALCIRYIKIVCELCFCHKDNKKPYKEREKDFYNYIEQQWCKEAIEHCNTAKMIKSDLITYNFIIDNNFNGMCSLIKKSEANKNARYLASLIGLNKLKNNLKNLSNRG